MKTLRNAPEGLSALGATSLPGYFLCAVWQALQAAVRDAKVSRAPAASFASIFARSVSLESRSDLHAFAQVSSGQRPSSIMM